MRRTLLLLLLLLLCGRGSEAFAQRISISQRNISLNKVFAIIQQQSGYSLLYDNQLLNQAKPISIDLKDATVEEALDLCLKGLSLTYVITGKIIVIKEKPEPGQKPIPSPQIITGAVIDEEHNAVNGASVIIKELRQGTQTDAEGFFSFTNIPPGVYSIEITFVGLTTARKTIYISTAPLHLAFNLKKAEADLQEITVTTALGFTKKSKGLTYSMQEIRNNDINTVKNTNVLNSLNGKVAGMQVNRTSGGAGGSVRVVLRGDKSTRSSQPLYVIDGLPIINPTGGPTSGLYNGNPDAGDILSSLNPDDIESITILKGASASALYGGMGSNGVILISTKKGKEEKAQINFSSSLTLERAAVFPELQYDYAQSTPMSNSNPGSDDSWGGKTAPTFARDYVKDFFQTGLTLINSVNISSGKQGSSSFFSYSNTANKGIMPRSRFGQHSISFHQTAKLLNNKLSLDGIVIGSLQNIDNRCTPGIYFNPLTGLYLFPRGLDFNSYKNYEYFSPARYLNLQDWWNINYDKNLANGGGWVGQDYQQNPYWIVNRNTVETKNQNVYTSVAAGYSFNSRLSLQARGNINRFSTENQRHIYAGTQATIALFNGNYDGRSSSNTTLYGDVILTGNNKLSPLWNIDFTAGTSIQNQTGKTLAILGEPSVPNVFLESALKRDNISIVNIIANKQVQSVFANVQLAYDNKFFIDLSDRQDWSSSLAFTPTENKGYNYYSVGASAIVSEWFHLPSEIDFAKLRIAYAVVGNDIAPFSTYPLYTFNAGIAIAPPSRPIQAPGYYLQPEKNKSVEAGMQWVLFKNKLLVDFTWYQSNITNQYFQGIAVPPGLGTGGFADINAGDIQNNGWELIATYKIKNNKKFDWSCTFNLSHNKNRIKELFNSGIVSNPSPEQLYRLSGNNGDFGDLKKGGAYHDLFGRAFMRDAQGRMVINAATGIPLFSDDQYLGNPNPRFIAGLKNAFSWKDVSIQFLIDGKFGGRVVSITEAYLDQMGVSKRTGDVRNNGENIFIANAVDENGNPWHGPTNVKEYYKKISGKTPVGEAYLYNATAVRLRELSAVYRLPLPAGTLKELKIGFVANNLFFIYRKAPFDPEQVAGVNPGGVGVDVFGQPAYRSLGLVFNAAF